MRALAIVLMLLNAAAVGASPAPAATPDTAIVVEDRVLLRAEARDSAEAHAVLFEGELLEVRGERMDYLQVYDHRRERAGFVPARQLRRLPLDPAHADELMAVIRFLHDRPGDEALGIGYALAYLQAAAPEAIGAELFDALGTFADRLARRGSAHPSRAAAELISAHLEVARGHGVVIRSFERAGRMQLCYDGEAFRRVMALPASAVQKVRAALALTRPDCVDPDLTPLDRYALDAWRADVLARVPEAELPAVLGNRLRLRTAAVAASVAWSVTRLGRPPDDAGATALNALASVDPAQLADRDRDDYDEAALRVGASRWADAGAADADAGRVLHKATGLSLQLADGEPGQTCLLLIDARHDRQAPLLRHCSYATLWTRSARANAGGDVVALAAQPLDGWRELWLLQRRADGWRLDVVPPGDTLDLGYIEFAGWLPGQRKLLAARELRHKGRFSRSFDIIDLDTLAVDRHAERPEYLTPFYRHQDRDWKTRTLSLR